MSLPKVQVQQTIERHLDRARVSLEPKNSTTALLELMLGALEVDPMLMIAPRKAVFAMVGQPSTTRCRTPVAALSLLEHLEEPTHTTFNGFVNVELVDHLNP